ncbi:hypothetical protein EIP91_002924 [Steccherinum ochraceum]|uniref:Extracellular mutant protein 11 C-terminal domain-containing protein n=1 Tax=Steccherinum ochraceum TaxID=92696 RepID=A0A4R0RB87_9APHY|nr:hypothetical protein EIP91_002924 [Steccherinum ochraceum]
MSARQPFVPARSASRAATASSTGQEHPAGDNRFDFNAAVDETQPSPNNGHQPNDTASSGGTAADTSLPGVPGSIINGINKPLNLANFGKRKNKPEQHVFSAIAAKSRRSFEGAGLNRSPETLQQQGPRARPFSPFVPQTPHTRAPRHSSPSRLQTTASADDLSSNQAHISTSRGFLTHPGDLDSTDALPFSTGLSTNLRASSRPSLESIHENEEEERLMQAGDGSGRGQPDSHMSQPVVSNGTGGPDLRRSAKRFQHPEVDVEDAYEFDHASKRHKSVIVDDDDLEQYDRSSPYRQESEEPSHQMRREIQANQQRVQATHAAVEELALQRLLKQDPDKYVEEHLEAYNEARKKWSECSIDEWKAGADELTTKFAKMLDFVKDHMTAKIGLYTTLHAHVTNHRAVLSERDKTLKGAQDNLVRNGASVVGVNAPSARSTEEEEPQMKD